MPIYDSKCTKCGTYHEYTSIVASREVTPICCKKPTERVLSKPPSVVIAQKDRAAR